MIHPDRRYEILAGLGTCPNTVVHPEHPFGIQDDIDGLIGVGVAHWEAEWYLPHDDVEEPIVDPTPPGVDVASSFVGMSPQAATFTSAAARKCLAATAENSPDAASLSLSEEGCVEQQVRFTVPSSI